MAQKAKTTPISDELRRQFVDQWEAARRTGLDRSAFCEQHGISKHQLDYWQRLHGAKGRQNGNLSGRFAQVVEAKPSSHPPCRPVARLIIGGGKVVEIDEAMDPTWAARLIAAIGGQG